MQRTHSVRNAALALATAALATVAFAPTAWSEEPFGGDHDPGLTQEHLYGLGQGLLNLAGDPHRVVALQDAYERGSVHEFLAVLKEIGVQPPADQCDPYVTVYVTGLTTGWKVGTTPTAREIKKFVQGVCPPGTYGPPAGG